MFRQSAGVILALDHAERALHSATRAGTDTEERLGAVIEAIWWIGAGWDSAGRPDSRADTVLLGFWWVRNRSIHDIKLLVGDIGDMAGGDTISAARTLPLDTGSGAINGSGRLDSTIWGSMEEVRSPGPEDSSKPQHRVAYASVLEGNPVETTIRQGLIRLRALGESVEGGVPEAHIGRT
jgi:hypothetical protein